MTYRQLTAQTLAGMESRHGDIVLRAGSDRSSRAYAGTSVSVPAMTRAYLSWWNGSYWRLLQDIVLAGLVAATVPLDVDEREALLPYIWMTTIMVILVASALLVRRRFPWLAVLVSTIGVVVSSASVPIPVASYTIASSRGNSRATWAATVLLAVVVAVPRTAVENVEQLLFDATFAVAWVGAPVLLGLWVAQRRQLVAGLRERAEQAERERDLRAENAVAAERARIARELHDLVAHRVSQITVQAGALEVSTRGQGAEAASAIRLTGTAALEEMRELLGVLRRSEAAPLRPSPTLDSLGTLIDEARATGQKIHTDLPETLPEVSGATGRAIYRLLQEGLTNAAKHAPGATVDIKLKTGSEGLTVSVHNGPAVEAVPAVLPESGFGLLGMRERVELAGGTLWAGRVGYGFTVTATFPGGKQ